MSEQITKQDIKEIVEEQGRNFDVALKEQGRNFDVALKEQGRGFMVVLEDLNKKFDAFGESLDYVKERQDVLEKKINALEETAGELLTDMKWVKQEIAEIKGKLDAKIDRYEYEKLETRVTRLENYVRKNLAKV